MKDDVINLDDYRRHYQGECKCLACGHTWNGVAPFGVWWLECPGCFCNRGVFVNPLEPARKRLCCLICDSQLFFVTPDDGIKCAQCGEHMNSVSVICS